MEEYAELRDLYIDSACEFTIENNSKETKAFLSLFSSFLYDLSVKKEDVDMKRIEITCDGRLIYRETDWEELYYEERNLKLSFEGYSKVNVLFSLTGPIAFQFEKFVKKYSNKLKDDLSLSSITYLTLKVGIVLSVFNKNGYKLIEYEDYKINPQAVDFWYVPTSIVSLKLQEKYLKEEEKEILRETFSRIQNELIGEDYREEFVMDTLEKDRRIGFARCFTITHSNLNLMRCILSEVVKKIGMEKFEKITCDFGGLGVLDGKVQLKAVWVFHYDGEFIAKYAIGE